MNYDFVFTSCTINCFVFINFICFYSGNFNILFCLFLEINIRHKNTAGLHQILLQKLLILVCQLVGQLKTRNICGFLPQSSVGVGVDANVHVVLEL